MLNIANIFVCVFLCSIQGRLDGFPIPRPSPNINGVLSTTQLSASSSSLWTFPATRLHSMCKLLAMNSQNRILSSYPSSTYIDNGRDRIWSSEQLSPPLSDTLPPLWSDSLLQPSSDDYAVTPSSEQQPYPPFDYKDKCRVLYDSSQSSLTHNDMSSSPLSDNKLRTSSMSSCGMRLSNFRLSKDGEVPMILFDQNGKMYTNYYPPVRRRSTQQ